MAKSFWNRGASIQISSLTYEELKAAIHEWAEGSKILEKLLWLCHKKGVVTSGCDAGEHHFAYIDFSLNSEEENLKKILDATLNLEGTSMLFLFDANPKSGPDWYLPWISVAPNKNTDPKFFFKQIYISLKSKAKKQNNEIVKNLLEIANFFTDKETGLSVRIVKDQRYRFTIESFMNSRNWNYFNELFTEAGLKVLKNKDEDIPFKAWGIETADIIELEHVLKKLIGILKEKWTLDLPEKLTADMDFNTMALFMRRKFGTDEEGTKRLNEWINLNFRKKPSEICS